MLGDPHCSPCALLALCGFSDHVHLVLLFFSKVSGYYLDNRIMVRFLIFFVILLCLKKTVMWFFLR